MQRDCSFAGEPASSSHSQAQELAAAHTRAHTSSWKLCVCVYKRNCMYVIKNDKVYMMKQLLFL